MMMIIYLCFRYFNSIKVRLEPSHDLYHDHYVRSFQFHKGTIRTSRLSELNLSQNNFNSIKVRLELRDPRGYPYQVP